MYQGLQLKVQEPLKNNIAIRFIKVYPSMRQHMKKNLLFLLFMTLSKTVLVSIYAGGGQTLIVKDNGQIVGCGSNAFLLSEYFKNSEQIIVIEKLMELANVVSIFIADENCFFIDNQGDVRVIGRNRNKELGLGHDTPCPTLTKIDDLKNIVAISVSVKFTLALDFFGNVYQTGIHNFYSKTPDLPPIQAIACGSRHGILLDYEGNVWGTGDNQTNQLGLGGKEYRIVYEQITQLKNIKFIATGYWHTLVIDVQGDVFAFGNNEYGQLGLGDNENKNRPYKIDSLHNTKMISAGRVHTLALNEEGRVFAFGSGKKGQLGLENFNNTNVPVMLNGIYDIISIAAGEYHSLLLHVSGSVYAFGCNKYGELGLGDKRALNKPTQINGITAQVNGSCMTKSARTAVATKDL